MEYANTSNTQIVGIKNHSRDTWRDVQTQTSPITWALNITPVIRGEVRKLKQAAQITRVLKIVPAIRSGIYKHKQTVQITRVLKIIPAIRDGIREYKQPPKRGH